MVALAGIGELQPIAQMSFEQWRHMLAIHLDGTFLAIRHTVNPMIERGWGRVICFSSIASLQGVARQAHYAAGKGGVDALVRSFSREVAANGVTVNAIAPGYTESPLNDAWLRPDESRRSPPASRPGASDTPPRSGRWRFIWRRMRRRT